MSRKLLALAVSAATAVALSSSSARADDFDGTSLLSFGISSGMTPVYGSSSWPTMHANYEHFFGEDFAAGSMMAYAQSNYARLGAPQLKLRAVMIGARGSYHFHRFLSSDWLDPYAGASVGYGYVVLSAPGGYSDLASTGSSFFGVHAGANLMILPRMAAFIEAGNESMDNALFAGSGVGLTGGVAFHF